MTDNATITIKDQTYQVDDLPQECKDLIAIFQGWERDKLQSVEVARRAQIEIFKHEAALKALGAEIETRILALNINQAVHVDTTLEMPVNSSSATPSLA